MPTRSDAWSVSFPTFVSDRCLFAIPTASSNSILRQACWLRLSLLTVKTVDLMHAATVVCDLQLTEVAARDEQGLGRT